MSTTEKGDQFESRSLEIIQKLIEEEQLGEIAKYLKIYTKQPYYSHLRKKNIIFDLTIEVWPPGATRYVRIYIIECKNYKDRVPVSKIEDFHSKILQLNGVNVKGVFISNSPLQEAAYNIAESTGMMLIQGESSDDYKIILHRMSTRQEDQEIPTVLETIETSVLDEGAKMLEKLIDKKILSALEKILNENQISYGLDRLSQSDIIALANDELNKLNPGILLRADSITPNLLKEHLKSEYGIETVDIDDELNLSGLCDFESKKIGIAKSIIGTNREFFILAHEFGHFILHQKLSIGQVAYDSLVDSKFSFKQGKHIFNNPRHWIEWQANCFAAGFLLPEGPFFARLSMVQNVLNKRVGKIYVDDAYQNNKDFNNIVARLAIKFNVTKTTIIYRLNEMDLIINKSNIRSVGQLVAEYNEGFLTE